MPRTPNTSPQTLRVFAALLDRATDWHYGYPLSKLTGLAPGTLYPILSRLVDAGHLETRWEPNETAGRPARHLYRLTSSGREFATSLPTAAPATLKPAPPKRAGAVRREHGLQPRTAS